MKANKKCILFSGPPGCSKTPTAIFLSINLGLPVFNNDAIRSEVVEDQGFLDDKEQLKRRDDRITSLIKSGKNFILDASIDRTYGEWSGLLNEEGYESFIICFNLSDEFLLDKWKAKKYDNFVPKLKQWTRDHDDFLKEYGDKVDLEIDDENFADRLELALSETRNFLLE